MRGMNGTRRSAAILCRIFQSRASCVVPLTILLLSAPHAQQQGTAEAGIDHPLTVETVRDNLYVLNGGGGNSVVFEPLRAGAVGDMFRAKTPPVIDANAGGSARAFIDTLRKAISQLRNIDVVITGHGLTVNRADLVEYADFAEEFVLSAQ